MIETAILLIIGICIGWCVPQPKWAAALCDKAVAWVKGLRG